LDRMPFFRVERFLCEFFYVMSSVDGAK